MNGECLYFIIILNLEFSQVAGTSGVFLEPELMKGNADLSEMFRILRVCDTSRGRDTSVSVLGPCFRIHGSVRREMNFYRELASSSMRPLFCSLCEG